MAVLISRPDFGIYVGHALGFGFWSLLDTAGQDCAVTFPDTASAIEHINSWDNPPDNTNFTFHNVDVEGRDHTTGDELASINLGHLWPDLIPVL